jgi:hypothetical protein
MENDFIVNGFLDGTDFLNNKEKFASRHGTSWPKISKRSAPYGFGDMICQISNLNAMCKESATILTDRQNVGFHTFNRLINKCQEKYHWNIDKSRYEHLISISNNNITLSELSGCKSLHYYPDFEYVKLNKSKFIKPDNFDDSVEYATMQTIGSGRFPFMYDKIENEKLFKKYNIKLIDVGNKESWGLPKLAWVIDNAKFHLGIDSGMTHFALTIKNKNDVKIFLDKDRITGVGYRWINQKYNVSKI